MSVFSLLDMFTKLCCFCCSKSKVLIINSLKVNRDKNIMQQRNVRVPDSTHEQLKRLSLLEDRKMRAVVGRLYNLHKSKRIVRRKRATTLKKSVNLQVELWRDLTISAIEQRLTLTQYIGGLVDLHIGEVDELLQ